MAAASNNNNNSKLEQKLELLHANLKLAPRVGYSMEGGSGGGGGMQSMSSKCAGATYLGVVATRPVQSLEDFHGKDFAGMFESYV